MSSSSPEQGSGRQPEPGFEESLSRLEEAVKLLEEGNLTLDRSMELYEAGIEAYRQCRRMLEQAEGKVRMLVETLEGGLEERELELPPQPEGPGG